MRKKNKKGGVNNIVEDPYNKIDRRFSITSDQLGEGWRPIIPEKIKLTDERPYIYREVKGFALEDPSMDKLAQLLVVLFDYGDDSVSKDAFREIGKGLESEMPKVPNIGDESVVYEMELMHSIRIKVMSFRYRNWLAIFTMWLFKEYDVEDLWVKELMSKQLERIKGWSAG
ncbi:MAG: hypothetical protein HPY73_00540 [Methanomassiliicoccales archaeon]|nr:MAG: hypothetical protein HPY73_00540 [Methanomassiliicoccales archaeon]